MILGGAQENTLHTCRHLSRSSEWEVLLITGPPIGPEGELLSEARRMGIRYELIPDMRRAINPWRDAAAFLQVLNALRRFRPTIVQTHSSKAGILGRGAAWLLGVPVIIHTVEGLPFHRYAPAASNAAFILAERAAARVTDHIVCVARAMVEQASQAGIRPRFGFSIIHSGMDVDALRKASARRDRMRARFGFAPDEAVVGKIARLAPLKGHEFVLRAAPKVIARCPQARFLFVGDGVLRARLAAMAAELGVAERVVFAGIVPPASIPAMISAMDVLVHTSLREGLARVLVQALLAERPVITYNLDGAPEVIIDGQTGWLVQPGDVDALAAAIVEAIDRPEYARNMAREGRRRFCEEFSIETMARRTEELYRTLLARQTT